MNSTNDPALIMSDHTGSHTVSIRADSAGSAFPYGITAAGLPVLTGTNSTSQVLFGSGTNTATGSGNLQYFTGTGSLVVTAPGGGASANLGLVSNIGPSAILEVGNTGQLLIVGSTGWTADFTDLGLSITPKSGATGAVISLLNASGVVGIGAATTGTPNRINFPTTTGTVGQVLSTDGGSPQQTSWVNTNNLGATHTPSSSSDTGFAGQVAWDASYIYMCITTNTWKRTAITTW